MQGVVKSYDPGSGDGLIVRDSDLVEFELAAVFDLAGIRAPKRQCTRTEFPSIGTFIA